MNEVPVLKIETEIKVLSYNYLTDSFKDFEDQVRECLKDGWVIFKSCSHGEIHEYNPILTVSLFRNYF